MFGKLKGHETIMEGLERAPRDINMFLKGGNIGTLAVKR
jgi:NADPH-dependent curcumin reductase CurA